MDFICEIRNYIERIEALLADKKASAQAALPDGGYFLDADTVLCLPRKNGDARYPYAADGFNLWAHSSGYISINESTFYVVLSSNGGQEPYLNFYAGMPDGKGGFTPVSLTGVARCGLDSCKRYTVFTPQAVYYITRTDVADFAVRAYVTENKTVRFSVAALGKADTKLYLSSYINCFLMHSAADYCETPWFRECKTVEDGFSFYSVENIDRYTRLDNYGILKRSVSGRVKALYSTTSRSDYTGEKNNAMATAIPLFTGKFEHCKTATKFTDTAIAGDIIHMELSKGESVRLDYCLDVAFDDQSREKFLQGTADAEEFDRYIFNARESDAARKVSPLHLQMKFSDSLLPAINADVFEKFVGFVERQVEFAALSKNSGVSLLGVRDVFQQLEAALMWTGKKCRAKIVEALGFVGVDGCPPRQYSIPPTPETPPKMDLRRFIDQGVWIIDTVYRYLAYTADYTILDEICGYYDLSNGVHLCEERTTVLEHLLRISRFLISEIDCKTDCLHVLFGDWNDALDGMGIGSGNAYGTGVSVMATLQLYRNMEEMSEILAHIGKSNELDTKRIRERLAKGLERFAVLDEKDGKRILHGWGDERKYLVGSPCDPDGKDRVGLTSYSFWAISGMIARDRSMRDAILKAYQRLDSKYGLRTFDQPFAPGAPGVGRIGNLPEGTAENCATYVHAALFGIWSMFILGEDKLAWEQLVKILPFTHEHLSTTQFVMSNSYSYNEEFGMDGESMSDWYTGAANVLIKVLVRHVFGVDATLENVYVRPCNVMPFGAAEIRLNVRGCSVNLKYKKTGKGQRVFTVDGVKRDAVPDPVSGTLTVTLSADELKADCIVINVED